MSHWRLLNVAPPPQVREHSVQDPHWLQLPSTWQPGTDWHRMTPASQELRCETTKRKEEDKASAHGGCFSALWTNHVMSVLYQFLQSLVMMSPGFTNCQSEPPGHTHDALLESVPVRVITISETENLLDRTLGVASADTE